MPVTKIKSKWSSGSLVFYNNADMGSALHYFGIDIDATAITGEQHALDLAFDGVCSSGDSMVGGNFAVTPTGTSASWVSGIFAKVTQGSTKAVTGYISAGEFEINNSALVASAMACLVLNWNNSAADTPSQGQAYIYLNDYSSGEKCRKLFEFGNHTIGNDGDTTTLITANNPTAATHTIRFSIQNADYWLMCVNLTGLTA